MAEKFDVAKLVTDRIIEALEEGTVPWHQPWAAGHAPMSMGTGKKYRGINTVLLGMTSAARGYDSPYWGTFDNIKANGGMVKKGEKSTLVVFYKMLVVDDAKNVGKKKTFPMLRYFRVFNMEQAEWPEGLPPRFVMPAREKVDPIEACEEVMSRYVGKEKGGPELIHGGDAAFYRPGVDCITMPKRDQFDYAEAYYSTMFHEMTHSTGHAKRLAREGVTDIDKFGSHRYSKEELIAEMGAAMLCATVGIQNTMDASAAYIEHWLKVLKGDTKFVVQAASAGQKAMDLITGETVETAETAETVEVSA